MFDLATLKVGRKLARLGAKSRIHGETAAGKPRPGEFRVHAFLIHCSAYHNTLDGPPALVGDDERDPRTQFAGALSAKINEPRRIYIFGAVCPAVRVNIVVAWFLQRPFFIRAAVSVR